MQRFPVGWAAPVGNGQIGIAPLKTEPETASGRKADAAGVKYVGGRVDAVDGNARGAFRLPDSLAVEQTRRPLAALDVPAQSTRQLTYLLFQQAERAILQPDRVLVVRASAGLLVRSGEKLRQTLPRLDPAQQPLGEKADALQRFVDCILRPVRSDEQLQVDRNGIKAYLSGERKSRSEQKWGLAIPKRPDPGSGVASAAAPYIDERGEEGIRGDVDASFLQGYAAVADMQPLGKVKHDRLQVGHG